MTKLENVLKLSKASAKALSMIEFRSNDVSTKEIKDYLSCTRSKALSVIKELRTNKLVYVFNDRNGTYGDRSKGYKVSI